MCRNSSGKLYKEDYNEMRPIESGDMATSPVSGPI